MSVYHTSFNYLGINSRMRNLIVVHFDPDNGEQDTFLNLEPVYTNNAYGTQRYDYGAKYGSVSAFKIQLVKPDGSDFSVTDVRDCLRWLTGTTTNSTLDLLIDDQIQYSFIGRVTNVWNYKLDARIVGLIVEFTSNSPFAYSSKQTVTYSVNGTKSISINCPSDDLYSFVYMNTTYNNKSGTSLTLENETLDEVTTVTGLAANEVITIDNNMMITSDKTGKTFGNTFNYCFPRLKSGINNFIVKGNGDITFEYIYPLKIGNLAIDTDSLDGTFESTLEGYIYWSNILEKPTTVAGYGITDVYTKTDVDKTISGINTRIDDTNSHIDDVDTQLKKKIVTVQNNLETTQKTLNDKIDVLEENVNREIDELQTSNIAWERVVNTPTTLAEYGIADAYTKEEIDAKTTSVYTYKGSVATKSNLPSEGMIVGDVYNLEDSGMNVAWNGGEWDNLGAIVDLTPYLTQDSAADLYATKSNTYTKTEIDSKLDEFVSDDVYTKEEIDEKFNNLDISGVNTYTKEEIDEKINNITSSGVDISEDELNKMLDEILI